jgi:hypothetical protein
LVGSVGVGGSPRIGRTATSILSLSSTSHPFASSCRSTAAEFGRGLARFRRDSEIGEREWRCRSPRDQHALTLPATAVGQRGCRPAAWSSRIDVRPERDHRLIHAVLKQLHGGAMSQHMWTDPLGDEGAARCRGDRTMLGQVAPRRGVAAHPFAADRRAQRCGFLCRSFIHCSCSVASKRSKGCLLLPSPESRRRGDNRRELAADLGREAARTKDAGRGGVACYSRLKANQRKASVLRCTSTAT